MTMKTATPARRTDAKDSPRIAVRLPHDVNTWLRRAANRRRVSVSVVVRELVLVGFQKRSAQYK